LYGFSELCQLSVWEKQAADFVALGAVKDQQFKLIASHGPTNKALPAILDAIECTVKAIQHMASELGSLSFFYNETSAQFWDSLKV
jgi:hypothetical protein